MKNTITMSTVGLEYRVDPNCRGSKLNSLAFGIILSRKIRMNENKFDEPTFVYERNI